MQNGVIVEYFWGEIVGGPRDVIQTVFIVVGVRNPEIRQFSGGVLLGKNYIRRLHVSMGNFKFVHLNKPQKYLVKNDANVLLANLCF